MPIRFRCVNCRRLLSIGRRKAGYETPCPLCGVLQKVPDATSAGIPSTLRTQRVFLPARGATNFPHFISLGLGMMILGLLGWMIWYFPRPLPPVSDSSPSEDQLASLAQVNPLVLPEVEVAPRHPVVFLPARNPVPPPPRVDNARRPPLELPPPELPSPDRNPDRGRPPRPPAAAKEAPQREAPPPQNSEEEADALGNELVKGGADQQDGVLNKLSAGKGSEYTQALAAAIVRLPDAARAAPRQVLADRLARFTARTVLAYLGSEDTELRRAAAQAIGMKDDRDHMGELIDILEDPDPAVVQAARESLNKLTRDDAPHETKKTPGKAAETRGARTQPEKEKPSLPRPPSPGEKARVMDSPPSRAKKEAKDDIPDVGLVPPEETSPEMKSFVRATAVSLSSRRPADRIQAARALGEMGEAAKPVRRLLCAALLDPVIAVRVAAADALRNIDPKMHYLAVVLASENVAGPNDTSRIFNLLTRIRDLKEDGEPLAPLLAHVVKFAVRYQMRELLREALETLSQAGRRDLSSYRVIVSALSNNDPSIRILALRALPRMKHGKLAVPRLIALMGLDTSENRIAAIEALATLADESTEEIIGEAIERQRYHKDAGVRQAVALARNKLENKHTP